MCRHWISDEESSRCPAAEQCGVAQTRAPALHWNPEAVREYPCQACTSKVWCPKMEAVILLIFKVFIWGQISTPPEPLCLKDIAEQTHLPYSCDEGPDGSFWTSWLVLSVHASVRISAFFLLPYQSGMKDLSAVDRAERKAICKVQSYASRPVPA